MENDYELVIVGAGPAGCACALFLYAQEPRLRERIVVIDRAAFPREKICAGAIGGRADRALAAIGVHVDVPSCNISGLSVRAGGQTLERRLPGEAIGRVVRRFEYDNALLQVVQERGIEVRLGVALERLERRPDGVRLRTNAGELDARAVIGADGVGSTLRRLLGLGRGRYYAQAIEVDTLPVAADPPPDVLFFDLDDTRYDGYGWAFPTPLGGETLVSRGVYRLSRGLPARPQPDVREVLLGRLEAAGIPPAGLRFRRFAERGLALHAPFAQERALLIGEAAGIDPVLGEGIAQAVLYGRWAGRYLADCWQRGDFRFGDHRSRLANDRIGLDLRLRAAALEPFYGLARPWAERWLTRSEALADAGMHYFGGRHVPRRLLLRAAVDLVTAAAQKR